ncbi:MAG TPA: prepilin-type N-terminal cleavage/methylation domain-containing protein [Stellaceae bacterium]|nr:prepilin-type N-terminal cleavage/methylation domain-containing protein [Stellaceae bacterium]
MNRQRGFTLIEMLVVVAVAGFLVVGLLQGTRLGLKAWATQTRIVAERGQLDSTDRVLRQLITHLSAGSDTDTGQIAGSAQQFTFTTELPEAVATATRRAEVKLLLDSQHRLIVRWRLHFHEVPIGPPPSWNDAELLAGVDSVTFSFRPPGGTEWQSEWTQPNPPGLVKIHLAFPKGDPRHWPDITVAPVMSQVPTG